MLSKDWKDKTTCYQLKLPDELLVKQCPAENPFGLTHLDI
jgi:hypothetical protein